jgi:hypothetical protein
MTDVEWRLHEQEQSKLELPTEVTGGVVKHSNPELTTIAVYRGSLGDVAFSRPSRLGRASTHRCGPRSATCPGTLPADPSTASSFPSPARAARVE